MQYLTVQVPFMSISHNEGQEMITALNFAYNLLIIIGYITAIMCALVKKKKSNAVGFKSIFKKMLILIMVGVSNILDTFIIGIPHLLRTAIILFYISSEGTSFLKNASRLGLSIPKKAEKYF